MPELRRKMWESYAQQRAAGLSQAKAYMAAGFRAKEAKAAAKYAYRLEAAHPEIKGRITELKDQIRENAAKRAEIDREWVLKGLKTNYQRSMQEKEVLDRQGEPTGEFTYQGSVANRSLELMGKELGMFADRLILDNLDETLEGMSGTELRAYVRSAATEVGLRVVDMSDDETKAFIFTNAPRLGLRVEEVGADSDCAEDAEVGDVPSVSEAGGVPPTRLQ